MSVEGRPIAAIRRGDPAGRRVLVFGVIHGDEQAGLQVIAVLTELPVPPGVDLYLVESMNPDGVAQNTRGNANGVDLNRNFPYNWGPIGAPGDGQYAGPAAASEPETQAVVELDQRPSSGPRHLVSPGPLHDRSWPRPRRRAAGALRRADRLADGNDHRRDVHRRRRAVGARRAGHQRAAARCRLHRRTRPHAVRRRSPGSRRRGAHDCRERATDLKISLATLRSAPTNIMRRHEHGGYLQTSQTSAPRRRFGDAGDRSPRARVGDDRATDRHGRRHDRTTRWNRPRLAGGRRLRRGVVTRSRGLLRGRVAVEAAFDSGDPAAIGPAVEALTAAAPGGPDAPVEAVVANAEAAPAIRRSTRRTRAMHRLHERELRVRRARRGRAPSTPSAGSRRNCRRTDDRHASRTSAKRSTSRHLARSTTTSRCADRRAARPPRGGDLRHDHAGRLAFAHPGPPATPSSISPPAATSPSALSPGLDARGARSSRCRAPPRGHAAASRRHRASGHRAMGIEPMAPSRAGQRPSWQCPSGPSSDHRTSPSAWSRSSPSPDRRARHRGCRRAARPGEAPSALSVRRA